MRKPSEFVVRQCSDCGTNTSWQSTSAVAKGSTTREPGEAICRSCNAKRGKMLRELERLPDSLDKIKALRMTVAS